MHGSNLFTSLCVNVMKCYLPGFAYDRSVLIPIPLVAPITLRSPPFKSIIFLDTALYSVWLALSNLVKLNGYTNKMLNTDVVLAAAAGASSLAKSLSSVSS